ncbi:MAG TPA: hypothetical protein VFL16_15690 [Steroidobacteraceae bacterium]|nr:hypothetical protein [Steroidobacteraceae bacterium]
MTGKKKMAGPAVAQSAFLKAVRLKFFDENEKSIWPPDRKRADRIARAKAEIPVALASLIVASSIKKPMEADDPVVPGSALDLVMQAAAAENWPGKSKPAPAWKGSEGMFTRFEAAWCVNIMLEALARRSGGGGPKDWPVNP